MGIPPAEAAVAVKSTTGMLTAAGVWSGVIILALTVVLGIVRIYPKIKQLDNERRRGDLEELRARIIALEGKVDAANRQADAANAKSHQADLRLVTAVAAFQLVTGELRKHDPDSPALLQAQEMMASASTGDFGMDRALKKLSTIGGVGEME